MENELTEHIFTFICAYVAEHGYPPSQREIASGCYLSRSGVVLHLAKLVEQGRISREPHHARGISILRPLKSEG